MSKKDRKWHERHACAERQTIKKVKTQHSKELRKAKRARKRARASDRHL